MHTGGGRAVNFQAYTHSFAVNGQARVSGCQHQIICVGEGGKK
jgi:hypothetical protein